VRVILKNSTPLTVRVHGGVSCNLLHAYIEELENNVDKAHDELSKQIDDILATSCTPMDNIHKECIYFIAGAMIKAANDKIQQQRTSDSLRESVRVLVMLQTTTKEGQSKWKRRHAVFRGY